MLVVALLKTVTLCGYIIYFQVDMGYVVGVSISTWPAINKIFHKVSGLQDFILQSPMSTSLFKMYFEILALLGPVTTGQIKLSRKVGKKLQFYAE
jgi:hypothetical protein